MTMLTLTTLAITGFVSCAEFGSTWIRPSRAAPAQRPITVKQGLLATFETAPSHRSWLLLLGFVLVCPAVTT